jgi:hypothetical protein
LLLLLLLLRRRRRRRQMIHEAFYLDGQIVVSCGGCVCRPFFSSPVGPRRLQLIS